MGEVIGRPQSRRWYWIASIWLGAALFDATQNVVVMRAEGMQHAWTQLFVVLLLSWLPWALATPLVVYLGRRFPPVQLRPLITWTVHLGAWASLNLVSAAWNAWLTRMLNPWGSTSPPRPFAAQWFDRFYNGLLSALILYAVILVVSFMLDSRERLVRQQAETARLNEQLSKAQLSALRRQIEPHFLFNTLNAISGLVREKKNDAAVSMIAGLSDLMRRVLDDSNRQQVLLGEEMEFLHEYLEIEKVRFGERLQVSVDVPNELFVAQVPSLILQPMVENAVKHGISKRVQGGAIRISAFRSNGMLNLTVYNDGPRLAEDWKNIHSGIGIENVRTRLNGLYGNKFELRMQNQEPDGVQVSVKVPFQEG